MSKPKMFKPSFSLPFVSLFYEMLRDGDISPGRFEELVKGVAKEPAGEGMGFCNEHLADYSKELYQQLRDAGERLQELACLVVKEKK